MGGQGLGFLWNHVWPSQMGSLIKSDNVINQFKRSFSEDCLATIHLTSMYDLCYHAAIVITFALAQSDPKAVPCVIWKCIRSTHCLKKVFLKIYFRFDVIQWLRRRSRYTLLLNNPLRRIFNSHLIQHVLLKLMNINSINTKS